MRGALLLLAGITLAACEGGGDPVQQALSEEAAANHAEVALAREAGAQRRAAEAAERQGEMDRLRRDIAVAEAALSVAEEPEVRTTAEQSLQEARRALAALEADG